MSGGWVSDDGDDPAFSIGALRCFAGRRSDLYFYSLFRLEDVQA